jgi:hypothetical protein
MYVINTELDIRFLLINSSSLNPLTLIFNNFLFLHLFLTIIFIYS